MLMTSLINNFFISWILKANSKSVHRNKLIERKITKIFYYRIRYFKNCDRTQIDAESQI